MKVLLLITLLFTANNSFASDHWEFCSSADGNVKIEGETLNVEGTEIAYESIKVLSTIKHESETCIIEQTNQEMLAYDSTTTIEEVSYKYMSTEHVTKTTVICERGGSGIPAAWNCKN